MPSLELDFANPILQLLGGVVALLVVASLIGAVLHLRLRGRSSPTITNLNQRIVAWWWMVAVLATCFWLGVGATVALFAFASLIALREFGLEDRLRWMRDPAPSGFGPSVISTIFPDVFSNRLYTFVGTRRSRPLTARRYSPAFAFRAAMSASGLAVPISVR